MNKMIATVMGCLLASSVSMAAASKTTAKADEVSTEKSKYGVSFVSEINFDMAATHSGESDAAESYNYIAPKYNLSETEKIDVGIVFTTSRLNMDADPLARYIRDEPKASAKPGDSDEEVEKTTFRNTQQFALGSSFVRYSNSKVNVMGQEISASGRIYVPTSEAATLTGTYRLRGDVKMSQPINDTWTASYLWSPRYYISTKDAAGSPTYDGLYKANLGQKITEKVSFDYAAMYRHTFFNTGDKLSLGNLNPDGTRDASIRKPTEDNNKNSLYLTIGANLEVSEGLSFSAYVEQKRSLETSANFAPFEESESYYGLVMAASL